MTSAAAIFHRGISIDSICRLCFMERAHLEQIFDGGSNSSYFCEWIEKLTTLKIEPVPNAPASVCSDCKATLEAFDTFREMCFTNDRVFKEAFGPNANHLEQSLDDSIKVECDQDVNQPSNNSDEQNDSELISSQQNELQEDTPTKLAIENYETKLHEINGSIEGRISPVAQFEHGEEYEEPTIENPIDKIDLTDAIDDAPDFDINSSVDSDDPTVIDLDTEDVPYEDQCNLQMPLSGQSVLADTGKYRCSYCDSLKSRLHTLTHKGTELYKCFICSVEFTKYSYVTKHTRKWHNDKDTDTATETNPQEQVQLENNVPNSDLAATSTVSVGDFEITISEQQIEIDSSVEDSDADSEEIQNVATEKNTKTGNGYVVNNAFKCNVCCKKTSKLHRMTHKAEKVFRCFICHKHFEKMEYCSKHIQLHKRKTTVDVTKDEKEESCSICKRKVSKLHKVVHRTKGVFQCYICGKKWCNMKNLSRHVTSHDAWHKKLDEFGPSLGKPTIKKQISAHTCKLCNQMASKLHTLTHKKNGYVCYICQKKFDKFASVSKHVKLHAVVSTVKTPQRMDKSNVMVSIPISSSNMPRKTITIKKEPLISNEVESGDGFHQPLEPTDKLAKSLINRMDRFSMDTCKVCKKISSKLHVATHQSEGVFQCPICHKEFAKFTNTSKHIRHHRKVSKFVCYNCKRGFKSILQLKEHSTACAQTTGFKRKN